MRQYYRKEMSEMVTKHNIRKRTIYALAMLLVVAVLTAIIILANIFSHHAMCVDGVVDLTKWNFDKNGIVSLDGQWNFRWEDEQKDYSINVPSPWNMQKKDDTVFPVEGFGLYHLKVITSGSDNLLALKLNYIPSAYQLYIDNALSYSCGNPGHDAASTNPKWEMKTIFFTPSSNIIDIKIKVSNFEYGRGGLSLPVWLGTAQGIENDTTAHLSIEVFLFSAIFIIGILFTAMYFFGGRNKAYISMGVFAILLSLRPLLYGDVLLLRLFPGIPWEVFNRIFILNFASTQFMMMFIRSLYPKETSKSFIKYNVIFQNTALLAGLIISPRWMLFSAGVQEVIIIIDTVYIVFVLYRAIKNKDRWAYAIMISDIFLTLTVILDMLNNSHIIQFDYYYTPFGILMFTFVIFIIMAVQHKENMYINKILKKDAEIKDSKLDAEKKQRLISEKLNRVARDITSTLDLDEVLGRLLNHLYEIIPFTAAYIMLKENGKLKVCARKVIEGAGWVTEKYRYIAWNDGLEGPFFARKAVMLETINNGEVYTARILPLYFNNEPLGIFEVYKPKGEESNLDDFDIIQVFAEQAAIAINNARIYSKLKEYANVDSLTQAFTRRYFKDLADTILSDLRSEGKTGSLAMFDVDHFKSVNDKFGHIAGDIVLQSIVKRCMEKLPDDAVISRYGGEEFLIFFPYSNREQVLITMEQCRDEIRSKPVNIKQNDIHVTVSIGIAFQEELDDTLEHLIKKADEALYGAKRNGRDCICF